VKSTASGQRAALRWRRTANGMVSACQSSMNRTLVFSTLFLPGLTACGGGESALELAADSATQVEFSTSTTIAANPAPPVQVTVTDAAKAQALFRAAIALPTVDTSGVYNCPVDWGVRYTLTFTSGATLTEAQFGPNGCGWLSFTGAPPRQLSNDFWALLAATLGIQEATIFPYVPPGAP
jgi:hypothetical protein